MPEQPDYTWNCAECRAPQTDDNERYPCPSGRPAGSNLCQDCAEHTRTCHRCGDMIWEDDAYSGEYVSQYEYCEDCWNVIAFTCNVCDEDYRYDDRFEADGQSYCQGCFEERYTNCEDCGEPVVIGEICMCRQPTTAPTLHSKILCPRPFGVEIEGGKVAEIPRSAYRGTFSLVHDGSVSGDYPGELVSAKFEDDSGLSAIANLLDQQYIGTNNSCGLHLHIGPTDYDFHDLAKLWYFCTKNEPGFWLMVNPRRAKNQYCYPMCTTWPKPTGIYSRTAFLTWLYKTSRHSERLGNINYQLSQITTLKKKLKDPSLISQPTKDANLRYALRDWVSSFNAEKRTLKEPTVCPSKYKLYVWGQERGAWRYNWLNLNSYFYRGSVEIRSHEGTPSAESVTNWVILWQQVFSYVKKTPLKKLDGAPIWDAVKIDRIRDYYQFKTLKLYDQEEVEQCVGYLE